MSRTISRQRLSLPSWRRAIRERLGGVEGCTHLVELLGPLATTAYQTIYGEKARARREAEARGETAPSPDGTDSDAAGKRSRPRLLNSCHAFSDTGPVVAKLFPDWYQGPDS